MNKIFLWRNVFILFIATVVFSAGVFSILLVDFLSEQNENISSVPQNETISDNQDLPDVLDSKDSPPPLSEPASNLPSSPPPEKLANPPEIIKAVYVTGWSAGSKNYLNYLSNLFLNTEINAVVVDIKDYSGLYAGAIYDIDSLIKFFHGKNIYVIGRISVFQDLSYAKARPELAVYDEKKSAERPEPGQKVLWQDNKGLYWLDPASKDVWDYNISLAKDAFSHGFDEINFDYVRFPSDGEVENMGFPVWDQKSSMASVIENFFQYLRTNLADDPPSREATARRGKISVDLFGQTTTSADDMGIGQVLENAFENFDYISPMVYPSHYVNGFAGFENPAEHPYEVVKYSLDAAVLRGNNFSGSKIFKFRPWLQDFDLGADYTAEMVKQEIQAVKDSLGDDFNGYMLWSPSNVYTLEAILKNTD